MSKEKQVYKDDQQVFTVEGFELRKKMVITLYKVWDQAVSEGWTNMQAEYLAYQAIHEISTFKNLGFSLEDLKKFKHGDQE